MLGAKKSIVDDLVDKIGTAAESLVNFVTGTSSHDASPHPGAAGSPRPNPGAVHLPQRDSHAPQPHKVAQMKKEQQEHQQHKAAMDPKDMKEKKHIMEHKDPKNVKDAKDMKRVEPKELKSPGDLKSPGNLRSPGDLKDGNNHKNNHHNNDHRNDHRNQGQRKPFNLKEALEALPKSSIKINARIRSAPVASYEKPRVERLDDEERKLLASALGTADGSSEGIFQLERGWILLEVISLLPPDSNWRQAAWDHYSTSSAIMLHPDVVLPEVMKAAVNEAKEDELQLLLARYPSFLSAWVSSGGSKQAAAMESAALVFERDLKGHLFKEAKEIFEKGLSGDVGCLRLSMKTFSSYLKSEATARRCLSSEFAFLKRLLVAPECYVVKLEILTAAIKTINQYLLQESLSMEMVQDLTQFFKGIIHYIGYIFDVSVRQGIETKDFLKLVDALLQSKAVQNLPEAIASSPCIIGILSDIRSTNPLIYYRLEEIAPG